MYNNIYNNNYNDCDKNSLVNVIFLKNNFRDFFYVQYFRSHIMKKNIQNHTWTRQVEKLCQIIYNNKLKNCFAFRHSQHQIF